MNNFKLLAATLMLVATTTVLGVANYDYSQRNVTVGQEFSISFDYQAGTPVMWYALAPTGPGIELVSVENEAKSSGMRTIKAQGGILTPQVTGGPRSQIFTFKATAPTGGAVYGIRFIKIDFSNKIYDSKTILYKVAPKIVVSE